MDESSSITKFKVNNEAECERVRVCYLCLGTKLTQTKWVELLLLYQ